MMRIILLCFVATEFIAEEIRKDLFKKTLHELMEIEVTSVTKTELDYRTSPSAVLVYTQDDFKNYPGTRLVDFLRNILGAQVFYSSRSSLNFSLRGSVSQFSNKLQVLINGQSITSFPFSGIFWTDYDIPLAWIERIEVLKGQHGAVWGSNNVNGVINIILKRKFEYNESRSGRVDFGVLSGKPSINLMNTKTFDNSTVTMLGETTVLEESERVRDWKIAPVDETSLSRLGVLTNHTFEKLKLSTHLLGLSASRNDLFVLKYPYDKPEDLLYGEGDFRGVLGSVSVSRSFSNADLIISYKPSFGDKEFGFVRVSDIRHSFDMRYVHDFDSTRTTAGVSFDYVIEDSDNSRYFAFLPSDRSFSVKTVFSQIEKEFLDKKGIGIVSIALENNSFTGSNLSGNLRLGYSPTSSSFLWGSVGRAFKLPSRIERDMIYAFRRIPIDDFYSVDGVLLGNNRVKDEQAVGVEGGTRLFVTDNYMIDLSVFRYWYDNLITFSPDSNLVYNDFYQAYVLPFQIENNAEGTAHGVELLNKFQLKELISFDLGYAYFKGSSKLGQKHQSDVLFVEPELRAPEHSVLFRPTLHFGDLVFDFVFRYWNSNKFLWDDPFITVDGGITYSISDTDTIKIVARNLIKTQDFETPSFAGYSMSADLPREFGVYYTRLF